MCNHSPNIERSVDTISQVDCIINVLAEDNTTVESGMENMMRDESNCKVKKSVIVDVHDEELDVWASSRLANDLGRLTLGINTNSLIL